MALHRSIDGPEPGRPEPVSAPPGEREIRLAAATTTLAWGTLACPCCDAPVAPPPWGLSPGEPIACGYCAHAAAVRDFLSLAPPPRPARVRVRVVGGPLPR